MKYEAVDDSTLESTELPDAEHAWEPVHPHPRRTANMLMLVKGWNETHDMKIVASRMANRGWTKAMTMKALHFRGFIDDAVYTLWLGGIHKPEKVPVRPAPIVSGSYFIEEVFANGPPVMIEEGTVEQESPASPEPKIKLAPLVVLSAAQIVDIIRLAGDGLKPDEIAEEEMLELADVQRIYCRHGDEIAAVGRIDDAGQRQGYLAALKRRLTDFAA